MPRLGEYRTTAALLGAALSLTLVSTASAADFTLKFGGGGQNEPIHDYLQHYEKCLEPASGGRIDVQLYPGTQLGGVASQIQGMQVGTIEAAMMAGQHMKGVDKRYGVVDAPGLFSSFDHANASYWDPAFRDRYLEAGKDKGVMGIGIFAYGPTSFETVEPVKTLDDFEGLKIRILATDIERKLTDAMGATGIQVDWPDLLPALQRGQIDGVHSNIVLATSYKFYTVAKNATLTNVSMIPVVAFVSVKFFDSLPADLQEAVLQCGRQVEQELAPIAAEYSANAEAAWKEGGGEIFVLDDADMQKLNEIAQAIGDEVFTGDPDIKEFYELLKAAAERNGN